MKKSHWKVVTGNSAMRINPKAAKNRAALRKAHARKRLNRKNRGDRDPKNLAAYAKELEVRRTSSAPTKSPPPTRYEDYRPPHYDF